ncbi:MAG: hypothetical protein WC486_00180 [Candidatus Omnitrophota bacterium]
MVKSNIKETSELALNSAKENFARVMAKHSDTFEQNDAAYLVEFKILPALETVHLALNNNDMDTAEARLQATAPVIGDLKDYLHRWLANDIMNEELLCKDPIRR